MWQCPHSPDLNCGGRWKSKPARRDADDGAWRTIKDDVLANNDWIFGKVVSPKSFADDSQGRSSWAVVASFEEPSHHRLNTENREEISSHTVSGDSLRSSQPAQGKRSCSPIEGGDPFETLLVIAPGEEIGNSNCLHARATSLVHAEHQESVRMRVRQWPQQYRVHHAEHRAGRTDTDSNRPYRRRCEHWRFRSRRMP